MSLSIHVFLTPFMNSLIVCSNSHVASILYFFMLDRVSNLLVLVPRADSPPKVTPHIANPPVEITN